MALLDIDEIHENNWIYCSEEKSSLFLIKKLIKLKNVL